VSLTRVPIPSPNYSSRGGATVRLIVVHTAEGAPTYQALGNYFASPSSGVSSHVGVDDTPGTVGEYVARGGKAWTAANANPVAVQAELCAFAAWDLAEWHRHPVMLQNLATWIAEEAAAFGIPIVTLSDAQAQGTGRGVCQHKQLGAWGGNHSDCGPQFPMGEVLSMALAGGGVGPAPTTRRSRNMIASTSTGRGYWCVTADGAVYSFGDAAYAGGAFDLDPNAPGRQPMTPGTECVGIAGKDCDGYWLFASDGGVFSFGSAMFYGRPDRF
jgi:hypothetical protein